MSRRKTAAALLMSAAMTALPGASWPAGAIAPRARPSRRLTSQRIAQLATGSTVFIVSADKHVRHVATGTGFVVAPGLVATASHVLSTHRYGLVCRINTDSCVSVESVAARDAVHDVALLRVPELHLRSLQVASRRPSLGDTIYTMGNPEGLQGTFSQGIISAFRHEGKSPYIQFTAPVSPGSSGGPVLDVHGQVLGVVVQQYEEGQNINFAVSAVNVTNLLKKVHNAVGSGRAVGN